MPFKKISMPHITLTVAQPFYPEQKTSDALKDFALVPLNAKSFKIKNVTHNGHSFGFIITFIDSSITGFHVISNSNIDTRLDVMFVNKNPSYYINLDRYQGDATEVSFDIEFE